jgi:hypothetical protein
MGYWRCRKERLHCIKSQQQQKAHPSHSFKWSQIKLRKETSMLSPRQPGFIRSKAGWHMHNLFGHAPGHSIYAYLAWIFSIGNSGMVRDILRWPYCGYYWNLMSSRSSVKLSIVRNVVDVSVNTAFLYLDFLFFIQHASNKPAFH